MIVEAIPYGNAKERLQLISEIDKQKSKITIYKDYIYVERTNYVYDGKAN